MPGLHHITAIAGNALRNFDFYTRTLGLRLVKRTVNFDDPGTYHFYYGDETGRPGTILTFFPWDQADKGRAGVGETQQTAFRVPERSLGYWTHRLIEKGVAHEALEKRFGESVLPFSDPDGMSLALVGVPDVENEPMWSNGEIPAEHAIRGFHGVTLLLDSAAKTGAILSNVFGFKEVGREGSGIRYRTPQSSQGSQLLSLDLFPRAGRRAVRNRNRRPGLCRRRAGGRAWPIAEAARVSRAVAAKDRESASLIGGRVMSAFIHRFEPGAPDGRPLLLLHGTGGDENDLIPLGKAVAPSAPLLSPRGKVLEHGMPRFFRRLAEGVFDEDDVRHRADELADFVENARKRYGLAAPIALGYSNGANVAAAMLLRQPQALFGAILLRAMVPLSSAPRSDLGDKPVLIISGAQDPIVPASNSAHLAELLRGAGAAVDHRVLPVGHRLSNEDVTLARRWLNEVARADGEARPWPRNRNMMTHLR